MKIFFIKIIVYYIKPNSLSYIILKDFKTGKMNDWIDEFITSSDFEND